MKEESPRLTLEELKHRRECRIEFTAGLLIGIVEGIFFCWIAGII